MGAEITDFKATKCKYCYKCVRYCGVKAIQVKDERVVIMLDKYILCGHCLRICPQSAKTLKGDLGMVHGFLRKDMRVVVPIASPYMGSLRYKTIGRVRRALPRLGFEDVRETSGGAAFAMTEYAKLLAEHKMGNIITTCCPSANDLVEIYYPQLIPYLVLVVSPMTTHGELLREEPGRDAKIAFLGPCIAKKKETLDLRHEGYTDAVLDFNDISKWLEEEDIAIEDCKDRPLTTSDPKANRLYLMINGVANLVLATEEKGNEHREFYVHGEDNYIDLYKSMSRGEIKGCFTEMNMCSGGCIRGSMVDEEFISRFRVKLDMEESICRESAEEKQMEPVQENTNLRKRFEDHSSRDPQPTEEQIWEMLYVTNKLKPEDELSCGVRGYPTCRERAIVISQHKAEMSMYILFMREKVESMANLVMETSPNIVLTVGDGTRIIERSDVGERYFGRTCSRALQMYLYELIDPVNFQWVFDARQNIHGKRINYPGYNLPTLQNIVYIEKENAVLATFIDITHEEEPAKGEHERKLETTDLTQKVIRKQMMAAQKIAGLLGEITAETEATLTKLCHSLLEDGSDVGCVGGELEREIPGVQPGSGTVPLKGVMIAGVPGRIPRAGQTSGAGHIPGIGEQKKPTGYVYIDSINPRGGKSGCVHLSNADLKEPGGNGDKQWES